MVEYKLELEGDQGSYAEFFDSGSCFGYSEVFDGSLPPGFCFELEGKTWLVDDQYCMNPTCRCNEALLSFFERVPGERPLEPSFAIRVSLESGSYYAARIEDAPTPPVRDEVVARFLAKRPGGALETLHRRYRDMKARGRELAAERQLAQERRSGAIPGRNELCPCGSGKKYKKCCGR